jgi:vacuolar protein sorting-associated protein 13A/C
MRVQVSSPHILSVNVTTTFIELAIAATASWVPEANRSLTRTRGGTPPYQISNQTGSSLQIWSNTETGRGPATVLQHGQAIDWRFDDWRSLREVHCTLSRDTQAYLVPSISPQVVIIA